MILLLSFYAAYFNRIWHYSVCFTLVSEHWKSMHAISYCYISQLLTLPTDGNAVIKQNFVYIMLFRDIY